MQERIDNIAVGFEKQEDKNKSSEFKKNLFIALSVIGLILVVIVSLLSLLGLLSFSDARGGEVYISCLENKYGNDNFRVTKVYHDTMKSSGSAYLVSDKTGGLTFSAEMEDGGSCKDNYVEIQYKFKYGNRLKTYYGDMFSGIVPGGIELSDVSVQSDNNSSSYILPEELSFDELLESSDFYVSLWFVKPLTETNTATISSDIVKSNIRNAIRANGVKNVGYISVTFLSDDSSAVCPSGFYYDEGGLVEGPGCRSSYFRRDF